MTTSTNDDFTNGFQLLQNSNPIDAVSNVSGRPSTTSELPNAQQRTSAFESFLSKPFRYWITYSLLFLAVSLVSLSPFLVEHKSLIYEAYDGITQQYVFFAFLGDWIRGIVASVAEGGGITAPLWNLSLGFGGDNLIILLPMLSEPITFISALFPMQYSEYAFGFATIARFYLAGISFSVFSLWKNNSRYGTLLGAVTYSYSGWILASMIQSRFAVALIAFPIIVLGIEKIFRNQKPYAFVLAMGFLFATSFYYAYMACLALVPYCLFLLHKYDSGIHPINLLKRFFQVVFLILVSVALAGVSLLPMLNVLLGEDRIALERVVPLFFDQSYYAELLRSTISFGTLGTDAIFSIGAFGSVCAMALFIQKGHLQEKALFLILIICAAIPVFGHIFNGFGYVSARWTWIFTLFASYIIALVSPQLFNLDRGEARILIIGSAILVAITLLVNQSLDAGIVLGSLFLFAFAFLVYSCNLFTLSNKWYPAISTFLVVLVMLSVSIQSIVFLEDPDKGVIQNFVDTGNAYKIHFTDSPTSLVSEVDDQGLWRYDILNSSRVRNNSMITGLHSFDFYSSYYNNDIARFFRDMEIADWPAAHAMLSLTGRTNLLIASGAKYLLAEESESLSVIPYGYDIDYRYSKRIDDKNYVLFKCNNPLPLAYTFSDTISQMDYASLTASQKQQALLQVVATDNFPDSQVPSDSLSFTDTHPQYTFTTEGVKKPCERVDAKAKEIEVTEANQSVILQLDNDTAGETYLEFLGLDYSYFKARKADMVITTDIGTRASYKYFTKHNHLYGGETDALINLGYSEQPVQEIRIVFKHPGIYKYEGLSVIVEQCNCIDEYVQARKANPVTLSESTNAYKAEVSLDEPQILYMTIPWSKGWKATLDGRETEIAKANTAFMAFMVPEGHHVIELHYETPGLFLGLACSISALVALIAASIISSRIRQRKKQ